MKSEFSLSPSSIVLSATEVLFGPSPTEVKANTSNSYSVYSSSPVTTLVNVAPLFIATTVGDPAESFFFEKSLNPVMIPCLEPAGGNCQDTVILVEELAVTVKLVGGCEGTAIEKLKLK